MVKPEILYMDEPFSALDALMSLRMQNELLRILAKEKCTVMLITHDVEEAIHLADRILVLAEGKMLAEGTPQEIASNETVQAAYLGKAAA